MSGLPPAPLQPPPQPQQRLSLSLPPQGPAPVPVSVALSDRILDITATVVSCGKKDSSPTSPIMYELYVCSRRENGTVELRAVRRRFKEFFALWKALRQSSPDLVAASAADPTGGSGSGSSASGEVAGALEMPQKKIFGNEGDGFVQRRRRELQRFLDELLADPRASELDPVREFLSLRQRPTVSLPRASARDFGGAGSVAESAAAAAALAGAEARARAECETLREQLSVARRSADVAARATQQLRERTQRLECDEERHAHELAEVRALCAEQCGALHTELADKQQQVFLLVRKANAVEAENEQLKDEAFRARQRADIHARAVAEVSSARDRARGRVAELEMRCATLQAALERALASGSTAATTATTPSATGADDAEKTKLLAKIEDMAKRVELFDQRCKDMQGEIAEAESAKAALEKACADADKLRARVAELELVASSADSKLEREAQEHKAALDVLQARLKQVEAERDGSMTLVQSLEKTASERDALATQLAVTQECAAADTLSLRPEIERLTARIASLNGDVETRDYTIAMLRFQARLLLHEVAVLTAEKSGQQQQQQQQQAQQPSPKRTSSKVPQSPLLYSSQAAESFLLVEQLEGQNAAYREQVSALGAEVARSRAASRAEGDQLRAQLATLREELAAERLRNIKLSLVLTEHGLAQEAPDEQKLRSITNQQQELDALRAEVADLRQRYFYSLAVSIKLQTRGTCEIAQLFNEDLPRERVPVEGWSRWIAKKMQESAVGQQQQSLPPLTRSPPPPALTNNPSHASSATQSPTANPALLAL